MIEDLVSTGKSSLLAVDALRDAGCIVKGMAAIFTYNLEVAKQARAARDTAREKSREMLQEAINNPSTSEDGKTDAQNKINEMASAIEKEGICEGALIAKGMSDAAVFISEGKVSVSVKSVNELTSEEIVKIKDIIVGNTGISADNIKISSIE